MAKRSKRAPLIGFVNRRGSILLVVLALAAAFSAFWHHSMAAEQGSATASRRVEIVLFWEPGCPFCTRARAFLATLPASREWLRVREIDVAGPSAGLELFQRANERFGIRTPGLPLIIVGAQDILGFEEAKTTGREIVAAAERCRTSDCPALEQVLADGGSPAPGHGNALPPTVDLPLVGPVPLAALSLPALTVLLAAIDGFNPCAMWVLVLLIGLLVGMQDRARMWVLGAVFLLTSGLVYLSFLSAWLSAFLVLGSVFWVRLGVGLVALGSGAYYLYAFVTDAAAECRVTSPEQRRKIRDSMQASIAEPRFLVAVAGIIILAVGVNLIELVCSAGIPAIYTEVLATSGLPAWRTYLYLLLYVAVFMADDAAIFVLAMLTLTATGMSSRYLRFSHLVGGITMLAIGALLIVAPGWLAVVP